MTPDLHSLTYFSRNMIVGSESEVEAHVSQILASARVNNFRLGVTGALLFSHGCFAQVLEGKLEDVEAVYNRILPDPRHADVRLLQFTPVEARSFARWSMAYAGQADAAHSKIDVEGLLQDPARIASREAGYSLVDVLREIVGQYDRDLAAD